MARREGEQVAASPVPRGRLDKRQAILEAAFDVFAREGYGPASVEVIATAAGAAKHTVYNHFGDKLGLLRAVIAAEAERTVTRNLAALDGLRAPAPDVRTALETTGFRLLQCFNDDRSSAMRRLVYAEIAQAPDLLDLLQGQTVDTVTETLADRLARLALAGQLSLDDPVEAAEQLKALLVGPTEGRSRLGTRHVPDADLRKVARSAVATFLRAFGPGTRPL
ncbi:TetR/AcrR family transcriptional regulator [Frankia nepalensis]|uniref:TetR/AcrR family transcriptional regulator n=1 Tax=Frankia nepalensis TaxID=1836974 RepID=UPI0027DCD84F|nr:TetR/AcrR family transcriptional regulator [Frankia nepalensis]